MTISHYIVLDALLNGRRVQNCKTAFDSEEIEALYNSVPRGRQIQAFLERKRAVTRRGQFYHIRTDVLGLLMRITMTSNRQILLLGGD